MPRDIFREIQKRETMQFVYAAFFNDRDDVYVKVGRSGTPYKRVVQIASISPFRIARAVFSCVGSIQKAESIECSLQAHLKDFRTRGEWYRFLKTDGATFSDAIRNIYAKTTGRNLEWTVIDMAEIRADLESGFRKSLGIADADKAA